MNLSTVEFVSLASLSAAGFLVLILLISLEWNLNLEDPDMSLPQMLWAVSVVIMTSHFVTELKAAVVLLGLAMVVIGANRLNRKEQIVFAVYSLTMYCMSMVILSQSSSLSTITEIVVMIAFSLILVCGPMLHRFEMSMLENVLVSKNKELSNALEQVKELAIKDDLTGAFNRRFLMDFLVQQKAQADRRDYVFTLCFIDLDFFKRVNDNFEFIAANILKFEDLGAFSINVSGNSLTEDDFMEFVLEQFNATRLPTSRICFEITETSAIGSLDDVVEFMDKLKIIGVEFSLDDFGTGLSSYSYLRNLPVDYLKIDGIFVKDIKSNPSDYAVVKSINEIGHFMGKKTIAEFVEDDEVLEILREIGVDFAQGYGIEKKRPIVELLAELS
jgi:predicted signal transduction protein with EAL and GGDEF domain|tara:strand:- start:515 stop:1675 length:1161 start_codon:yes stop_codon:yes gene_type:complete